MLDRAITAGATASYILMDSWFTHVSLIGEIVAHGLDVIGMVKNDNKRFLVQGRKLSLNERFCSRRHRPIYWTDFIKKALSYRGRIVIRKWERNRK